MWLWVMLLAAVLQGQLVDSSSLTPTDNDEIQGSDDGSLTTYTESSTLEYSADVTSSNVNELAQDGFIPVIASHAIPPVNNSDTLEKVAPTELATNTPETNNTTELGNNGQESITEVSTLTTIEVSDATFKTAPTEQATNTPETNNSTELGNNGQESITEVSTLTTIDVSVATFKTAPTEQATNTPETNNSTELGNNGQEPITEVSTLTTIVSVATFKTAPTEQATNTPETNNTNSISKPIDNITEANIANGTAGPKVTMQPPVEDVAGTNIVLFSIAVAVIFLILFTIYRQLHSRTVVDFESQRDTEMQDLIPKPQGEVYKNNMKYQDKVALGDVNVKLLTEEIEKNLPKFTQRRVDISNNKVDDENSLHNNTANGIDCKTPEIKTEIAAAVNGANPASRIQRTETE